MPDVHPAQRRRRQPDDMARKLHISLLGPLTIHFGSTPLTIPSKKARALLVYLAQREGEEIARNTLCDLLWGDRSEKQARASLRQTLSELRRALGSSSRHAIVARRDCLSWAKHAAWIDAAVIGSAVQSNDEDELRKVEELLRGEFLEGFSLSELAFEHWLAATRERYRQVAINIHLRLMELARESGDSNDAILQGLKLVSLDPLHEQAHRALMGLYAGQGRFTAALEQYERCKGELSAQVGVQPDPETEALVRSIKAERQRAPIHHAVQRQQYAASTELSLAVLPFRHLSDSSEQIYFADGMTEDIIGALSHLREVRVLSRSSSFAYKSRPIGSIDAARELGVRYVLEGSVRISSGEVRVAAQLIDGETGTLCWADRYDGELSDVFSVQDEITRNIALAMQMKLTDGDGIRLWEGQTKSLRAWEHVVRARNLFYRFNVVDNSSARRLLEKALKVDPDFTGARALLGLTWWYDARYNLSVDIEQSLDLAENAAERILEIEPSMASGFMLKGAVVLMRARHVEAIELCKKAVQLVPGDSHNLGFLGLVNLFADRNEHAAAALTAASRYSPNVPAWCTYNLSMTHLWSDDLLKAQEYAVRYLAREQADPFGYVNLATIHDFLSQKAEARACVDKLRVLFPEFEIGNVIRAEPYRDKGKLDRVVEVLRSSGL